MCFKFISYFYKYLITLIRIIHFTKWFSYLYFPKQKYNISLCYSSVRDWNTKIVTIAWSLVVEYHILMYFSIRYVCFSSARQSVFSLYVDIKVKTVETLKALGSWKQQVEERDEKKSKDHLTIMIQLQRYDALNRYFPCIFCNLKNITITWFKPNSKVEANIVLD